MTHAFNVMRGLGLTAWLGFAPYAVAQEMPTKQAVDGIEQKTAMLSRQMQSFQNDQKVALENQMDSLIQVSRTNQCRAKEAHNDTAKQFATTQLQERLSRYYNLTGHAYYRLPDCGEL